MCIRDSCQAAGDWTPAHFIETTVAGIREKVGQGHVICGLSGGVDSSVAAVLVHRAIGSQLTCIFVNNGVLRKNEFLSCLLYTSQLKAGRRIRYLGYGACALAGCLWGTGFYFGRLALNEMSVEHMVLYRFLFASLGMLPLVLMNLGRFRLTAREMLILFISAAFGIPIQFLLQFHGLVLTTVSHASLMVGSMPVLLAAAAAIFAGERLDWIGWTALCLSLIHI